MLLNFILSKNTSLFFYILHFTKKFSVLRLIHEKQNFYWDFSGFSRGGRKQDCSVLNPY